MGRWKAGLLNGALAAAAIGVSLLVLEATLRAFSPVDLRIKGDAIRLPYFKRYEIRLADAGKLDRDIVHLRNALGFRGDNPPSDLADFLSIVAVGGSTTESFYLSEGKTWPDRLGARLSESFDKLWINNAGLSGHTTFGHLRLMAQHVVKLRPKVALFLVGINDRAKAEASAFDQSIRPRPEGFAESLQRALVRNSELAALAWNVHRTLKATRLGIDGREQDFPGLAPRDGDRRREAEALAAHGEELLAAYRRRLERLVEISRENGILPVLVTQPAVYGFAVDPETGVDLARLPVEPVNGAVAWKVLELYNDRTRAAAAATGAPLVDLARALPKDTRYFYDFIHFSNAGAERVADILADGLCGTLQRSFPDHVKAPCRQPRS